MMYAGIAFLAISGLLALFLLVSAFRTSAKDGLLSIFIPLYLLYFAVAKFTSPKKGLIVGGWLGAAALGVVLTVIGGVQMAADAASNITMGDIESVLEEAEADRVAREAQQQ